MHVIRPLQNPSTTEKGETGALFSSEPFSRNNNTSSDLIPAIEEEELSTERDGDVEALYPVKWRRYLIACALLLSMFLTALDLTIVATAIPRITREFHSLADVGWYGSSFFVTFACFQSSWGKLYKYASLKWTFVGAVIVFEIGSAICGKTS